MQQRSSYYLALRIAIGHLVISFVVVGLDYALLVKHFRDFGATPTPYSPLFYGVRYFANVILFPIRYFVELVGYNTGSSWPVIPAMLLNSAFFSIIVFALLKLFRHFYGDKIIQA